MWCTPYAKNNFVLLGWDRDELTCSLKWVVTMTMTMTYSISLCFSYFFVWGGVNFQFFQNLHPGEEHAAWGEARWSRGGILSKFPFELPWTPPGAQGGAHEENVCIFELIQFPFLFLGGLFLFTSRFYSLAKILEAPVWSWRVRNIYFQFEGGVFFYSLARF